MSTNSVKGDNSVSNEATENTTESGAFVAMTPYAASKRVNAALEAAGASKRIPSQMMYNYTKQRVNAGKKPLIAFDLVTGVDVVALDAWTEAYVVKQLAKQNVVVDA